MKTKSILICLLFAITANLITPAAKAQVNVNDSLALVDLYNNTSGPRWRDHKNWVTAKPLRTWYGVVVTNKRVTNLGLGSNRLNGSLPSSIGNLDHLDTLSLTYNYLSGAIPVSIGNLASLKQLDLSGNQLSGAIPAEIGNLSNLTDLELNTNQLSGAIPAEIGNLSNLKYLEIISDQLSGSIPAEIGNLTKLEGLSLVHNQLTGTIPAQIGNLTNLQGLSLETNQLSGAIPAEIGNLVKLTSLDLGFNQLSGAITAEIGNLVRLLELDLNNNQFSGAIPLAIGNLVKLQVLSLQINKLSGIIPAEIGKLKNLNQLYLNNNQLTGELPASVSKFKHLNYLNISFNLLSQDKNIRFPGNEVPLEEASFDHNLFTFNGLEFLVHNYQDYIYYAPQNTILPIHQNGNTLSVSAGGTLSNNTYKWFKEGATGSTIIKGDSTFHPTQNGQYYAQVTNSVATQLTLYSDTISYTMPLVQTQNSVANVAAAKAFTNHFSIYPNPAKDIIHVQVNGNAMIVFSNSAGKIIFSKSINNDSEINVSNYANGVYYIQNKNTGETQKVVVVH